MQLGLLVPQALVADTHILPLLVPIVALIEVVPWPELTVAPVGAVNYLTAK